MARIAMYASFWKDCAKVVHSSKIVLENMEINQDKIVKFENY